MIKIKGDLAKILRHDKSIFVLMMINFIAAIVLLVFAIIIINPESSIVKVGYGDIDGYRDGTWNDYLVFPLIAILFGVLHNFLALKIFEKYNSGLTKVFLGVSILLSIGATIVLMRLSEGA